MMHTSATRPGALSVSEFKFCGEAVPGRTTFAAVSGELVSPANVEEALSVIKQCFPLEEDVRAAALAYHRYTSGELRYNSEFMGTNVELVCYTLYRIDGKPAGVSGVYKVDNDPGRIYMGWLGVAPEYRKSAGVTMKPLADTIMDDTKRLGVTLGATAVAAVAEDAASNFGTHRYYERHGFSVEKTFLRNGEQDRLYVCPLKD